MKFQKPTYEQQNEFLEKFVVPLIVNFDLAEVKENIRRTKKGLPTKEVEDELINYIYLFGYRIDENWNGINGNWKLIKYSTTPYYSPDNENIDTILEEMRDNIKYAKTKEKVDERTIRRNLSLTKQKDFNQGVYFTDFYAPCICGSGRAAYDCCCRDVPESHISPSTLDFLQEKNKRIRIPDEEIGEEDWFYRLQKFFKF